MAYHKPRKSRMPTPAKEVATRQSSPAGRRGMGGRSRQPRPIKSFDPSLFIKKVEEQVVAEVYAPKHTFADFPINAQLKENIIAKGYTNPTPIQDQSYS